MFIVFKNRYGFFDKYNNKFIGYIYEETNSGRKFSVANKIDTNRFYVNELDESFLPEDNTYSTLVAKSLDESKILIMDVLEGKR